MQIPSFFKEESFTRLLQGIAIGVILTWGIGFTWGGWTFGSTAEKMATERTSSALVKSFTPGCAEKFLAQADASAKVAALIDVASWRRDGEVAKTGFATLPGETTANMRLADSCADEIVRLKR
jgi:hypothetical protein